MNRYIKDTLELIFNLLYIIILTYAVIIIITYSNKLKSIDISHSDCYTITTGEKVTEVCEK
jgi:cell division protein YceG involved in septum cleavage